MKPQADGTYSFRDVVDNLGLKSFRKGLEFLPHRIRLALIRWNGYEVQLDGCRFDVSFSLIGDRMKTSLYKGAYERPERRLVKQYMPTDDPVVELGGALGVLACTVNQKLTRPDQHLVVEPNPELIPILKRNRFLNEAAFDILEAAVGDPGSGKKFVEHGNLRSGRLRSDLPSSGLKVPVRSLNEIVSESGFERFNLIMDIEGEEIEVLRGNMDLLSRRVPLLLVEFHPRHSGQTRIDATHQNLLTGGFTLLEREGWFRCYRNTNLSSPA